MQVKKEEIDEGDQNGKPLFYGPYLPDQEDYIAQFLNFTKKNLEVKEEDVEAKFSPLREDKLENMKTNKSNQQTSSKPEYKTKPKPASHNFQKHLVLVLRKCIDNNKFEKNTLTYELERELWNTFISARKLNKTLICFVLGHLEKVPQKDRELYGFMNIFDSNSLSHVQIAQQNLRKEVLRQLKSADLNTIISKRRLTNKQTFHTYFEGFISDLENDSLSQRISTKKIQP